MLMDLVTHAKAESVSKLDTPLDGALAADVELLAVGSLTTGSLSRDEKLGYLWWLLQSAARRSHH